MAAATVEGVGRGGRPAMSPCPPFLNSDTLVWLARGMGPGYEPGNDYLQPWRVSIKPGDHTLAWSEDGLLYLRVINPFAHGWMGPEVDLEALRATYASQRMRYHRFVRSFGVFSPDGAYDDVHVGAVLGIVPKAFFQDAKRAGWPQSDGEVRRLVKRHEGVIRKLMGLSAPTDN